MILVHCPQTWPQVEAGDVSAADATLGEWAAITDADADNYGDLIAAIYKNKVKMVYDVDGWTRGPDGRITFSGVPSGKWAHLVGTTNPGKPWVRGQARPVQYINTTSLTTGTVASTDHRNADSEGPSGQRAVIGDFVLTVSDDGHATLITPVGARVTVVPRLA